jgi:heme/copper-type cytochrome/quinol oxidase subunit 3
MYRRSSKFQQQSAERLAVRFFRAAVAVFALAAGMAWLLIRVVPVMLPASRVGFPAAFWFSTPLLFIGSVLLHRATWEVRGERQPTFRRALLAALVVGALFIGVQSFGLWCLFGQQRPDEVATGAGAFVFVFSFLHGLHFVVALLFLVYVTVQALAGRYDHEYYWGVLVCGYFWHALGVLWMVILAVFAAVT